MGPTNQALLNLFRADSALREAQNQLDAATRGVRVQNKRAELAEAAHAETAKKLRVARAKQMELDGDLKARDARIEHLREQQSNTENSRQYQGFLVEINKQKTDRAGIEDAAVAKLAEVEALTRQQAEQADAAKAEKQKAAQLDKEIGATTAELRAEIDRLQPERDAKAEKVPSAQLAMFDRLADNFDGEAMAAVGHIEGKQEGYFCTGCNMVLVVDVYNRLMTRDTVLNCPGCGRILYVPEDLTPEMAVRQKKVVKKSTRKKAVPSDKPLKKGQKAAKSKKAVTAGVRRIITTAAAESLRSAELEGTSASEAEVFVGGESAGTFRVGDVAGFARLVNGKLQGEDLEQEVEVREAGGTSAVSSKAKEPTPDESEELAAVGASDDED